MTSDADLIPVWAELADATPSPSAIVYDFELWAELKEDDGSFPRRAMDVNTNMQSQVDDCSSVRETQRYLVQSIKDPLQFLEQLTRTKHLALLAEKLEDATILLQVNGEAKLFTNVVERRDALTKLADEESQRNGNSLEELGWLNALTETVHFILKRIQFDTTDVRLLVPRNQPTVCARAH